MSIETWKEEFYPVTAAKAAVKATDGELIEHCLIKWRGATDENLAKHELRRDCEDGGTEYIDLVDDCGDFVFAFGTSTCALCKRYFAKGCLGCPLVDYLGQRCYMAEHGYGVFADGGPPDLMIQELEGALLKWQTFNGGKDGQS